MSRKSLFVAYVLSFCGVMWGAQQASRPTTPAQTANVNQARATISGTVNSASSGQPVRKALVTLLPANQGNRGQQGFGGAVNAPGQPAVPAPAGQTNAQAGQTPRGGPTQNGQNRGGGGGGGARSITAADDGTFTFTDVAPGTYRIRVDRDGFLPQEYGQRSWTGTGVPLTVMAGQTVSGIGFQLVQGGTIVGRILDENFEPVTDIEVQSLTYSYQNGTRTLVSERQVQTNDLGEYRLYWLTPGDHYVSAVPRPRRGGLVQGLPGGGRGGGGGRGNNVPNAPGVEGQPEETYASTFYPGSIDPERAAPVRVSPASEIRGIDFVLRPTPTVRVGGRVTGVDVSPTAQQLQQQAQQQNQQQARGGRGANNAGNRGNPPIDNRGRGGVRMEVLLTRLGTSVSGGRGGGGGGRGGGGGGRGGLNGSAFFSPVNPDGTFEIANVIPGSYNLFAIQQAPNQIYSTRVRLEVGPGGVHGLNLAVRPGIDVPGQIYVDGTAPSDFQMNRLRVNLNSLDDLPIGNSNAQVDETGKFNLTNVAAMSYRINVQGLPAGAYLIAGRFGNTDALGDPLQVDQSSPLSLQIGFNAGQIGVNVTDSLSQPFSGAITVLIPAVRTRLDLYKTATSDSSGQVVFTGVAPGDYKILAWEDVPQGAYLNADFVQPYEDRAQSVHVDRGGAISAQMKVIPRDQQ